MERTQELFEKINSYLNNEMKGNTLKAFEDLLKTDKVFQLEVEKHRLVQQALKDEDTLLFREKLRVIDQELHENDLNASTKKGTRYFWKIAAIFIIFIGLPSLIWFWNMPQE